MKKRIISLLLVLSTLLSMLPMSVLAADGQSGEKAVSLENPFVDVKDSDWFYDAVQYVRINGIFNGTSHKTFDPNGTMTRGMFVTVLGRMAGVDASAYEGDVTFDDVSPKAYYAPYVAWASKYGITNGTGKNKFSPDQMINRQEMAALFARYFKVFDIVYDTGVAVTTDPADLDQVADWAKDSVLQMWQTGLLIGDNVNFDPTGDATRAQNATICQRTDEVVVTWYQETGVPSNRVRLDPATGLPYTGPKANEFTVEFYDGDTLLETMYAVKEEPLGKLPSVEVSSKENAILLGYFTDAECTQPFYAENPVTGDMKVYAKYQEMQSTEELNFTSFAQMDQKPDLSFTIKSVSGEIAPEEAFTLSVKDGTDPVELAVTEKDGNYVVSPVSGFNKGSSYELTLAEGWVFVGKDETIRTAAFSIAMEEVEKIEMSDDIIYIQDTDALSYIVDGKIYDVLTTDLVTENGGSFTYKDVASLNVGDILCFYTGVHPEERENNADLLDPATYVKITLIQGTTVMFANLDSEDQQLLYDVPDNFPILVDALPAGDTGSVCLSALDEEMYLTMLGEEEGTMEKAVESIAVGDFVTLYTAKENIASESDVYFGQITAYDPSSKVIIFEKTTKQTILESMDQYAKVDISGDDLVTEEEKAELEAMLYDQVQQSGFAEEAAFMLADMVTKTDGFRDDATIQDFLLTGEDGQPLTPEQIELLNLGASFELCDDIELTVELITSGEQLHFGGGVQLAIGVDAQFEVEAEEGKVAFDLSATFVQEVTLDPSVKGSIVYKEILWIPVPIGVQVGATIDIKSYTALSFAAEIYTVEEEDKSTWEKIQAIAKDPTEALGLANLPAGLTEGLKTVGDVMDKIDELENKIDQAQATAEQLQGYADDINSLWAVVEESGLTSKEDWEKMGEALGKTSVTAQLLDMMNLTQETGLSTEYYDSMQALMDRYCEMIEKETGWVTLVDQEILTAEVNVLGLAIGVEARFVVRTDMSIAIGSNLEYEVGKRYNFWFKIGLFKPTAGSSSMDLIDEKFSYQFYVMGRMGVKAGIRAKVYVGLGSGKFASVGVATELGPYIKLWGFFVYEINKYRPANSANWTTKQQMAGALDMEFGLYFMLGFEANALGDLFEASHDLVDEEIPLIRAGVRRFYYGNSYEPEPDEMVVIRDEDDNSATGITMALPDALRALKFLELQNGLMGTEALPYSEYNVTLSNPNFSLDKETGKVSVTVPEGTRYMECDLTLTYLHSKMAFSQYDMTVTIPLVWTNLSTAELKEYYTASVRVGNNTDGYETVWNNRVLKNEEYDLPDDEEIMEIIGWNEYKYEEGTGYNTDTTTGLTLVDNEVYDYNVAYKTYTITVEDVQLADGSTESRTFTARYGKTFDFSSLNGTGTNLDDTFTRFAGVSNDSDIDLTQPINSEMADALETAVFTADYVDNSVSVTFSFTGVDIDDVELKVRKGAIPSLTEVQRLAAENEMAIQEIFPAVSKADAAAVYQVVCMPIPIVDATIVFESNGGSDVEDLTQPVGTLLGTLPTPELEGYTFAGWFSDEALQMPFESLNMPENGAALYAKWTANEYQVSFHVNGGDALAEEAAAKTVTFDAAYGGMPEPVRTGFTFLGWFTDTEGGEEITAESLVALAEDHTLYAQWVELKAIPSTVFDFGEQEVFVYEKDVEREVTYTFVAGEADQFDESEFEFKFMRQGNTEYEEGLPVRAGTYNLTVSRSADKVYEKFEHTYEAVLQIDKAIREPWTVMVRVVDNGYTWAEMELVNDDSVPNMPIVDGGIFDLNEESVVYYNIHTQDGVFTSDGTDNVVRDIPYTMAELQTSVTVIDPNYEDWTSDIWNLSDESLNLFLQPVPEDSWSDEGNYDISWWSEEESDFFITDAASLAGVAYLTNSGTDDFWGDTIFLENSVDMTGHAWVPIGTSSNPFRGHFDGQGNTVHGMYCSTPSSSYVGLFGLVQGMLEVQMSTASEDESTENEPTGREPFAEYELSDYGVVITLFGENCVIENVVVDDSYFRGHTQAAGIAGCANTQFTGQYASFGSVISNLMLVHIDNCTNYAEVHADGNYEDENAMCAGILGYMNSSQICVSNCVNYGYISGGQDRVAGIVGFVGAGTVTNNVNFGYIYGTSRLGGIVGTSEASANIMNNYNLGKVYSGVSNNYIGAVVGRNVDDEGSVIHNYYRSDSTTGKDGDYRAALGNKGGSVADGKKGYIASSFSSPESSLYSTCNYHGMTLIDALNSWANDADLYCEVDLWIPEGPGGYPIQENSYTSEIR